MSDPRTHAPAPASPDRKNAEHTPVDPSAVKPPSAKQVDKLLGSTTARSRIAAPSVIDLGDHDVGEPYRQRTAVLNLDHDKAATVGVALEGPSSLLVSNAPARLRPAREGVIPEQGVELLFTPNQKGRVQATLDVTMAWDDGTFEERSILVRAGAHRFDEPTLDEQDAAHDRHAERAKEEHEQATADAALDKQIDQQDHAAHLGIREGTGAAALEHTMELAGAWKDLYEARATAVEMVGIEIGQFARAEPRAEDESLAMRLALLAIDVVTGGLSSMIGDGIKALGNDRIPKAVTAVLGAGVKEGVKHAADVAKHQINDKKPEAGAPELVSVDPTLSNDPIAAFVTTEKNAVSLNANVTSTQVANRTHDALVPVLRSEPDLALSVLKSATTQVGTAAKAAQVVQANAARSHWMQYLAHTRAGAVPAPEHTESAGQLTDPASMMSPSTRAKGFDGVVDVFFTADLQHPAEPVKPTRVRINGVKSGFATSVIDEPLLAQAIPLRALGEPSMPDAQLPISVTRDEAGTVRFDDGTAPAGQTADWLARHAGEHHGSPGGELRGARKILEDIMLKGLKGVRLENDDAKKK